MTENYKIPKEIEDRIPAYFYFGMAGELVAIYGTQILELRHEEEGDEGYYYLDTSTYGWYEAFRATCRKLDMWWLVEYYDTLDWYDGDLFDAEIEDEIIERICQKERISEHPNCYYKYLCERSKKDGMERD